MHNSWQVSLTPPKVSLTFHLPSFLSQLFPPIRFFSCDPRLLGAREAELQLPGLVGHFWHALTLLLCFSSIGPRLHAVFDGMGGMVMLTPFKHLLGWSLWREFPWLLLSKSNNFSTASPVT